MSCNIVFDYVDSHKSEYWYKCTHCGARDWFAHYGRPTQNKPIKGCNPAWAPQPPELEDMTREQLIGQIIKYRKRIDELEGKLNDKEIT